MARKQNWFNPYHIEANAKKTKPSHTPGKQKGGDCQKSAQKSALVRARAYKTCKFYDQWNTFFPNCGASKGGKS